MEYYHIIFQTKYSRRHYKNKEAVILDAAEMEIVKEFINNTVKANNARLIELSVLPDHVHLLVMCDFDKISGLVKKIKGKSAADLNKRFHGTVGGGGYQQSLWSRKYFIKEIKSEEQLYKTIEYIRNNELKHSERWTD
jgi:putative transposase